MCYLRTNKTNFFKNLHFFVKMVLKLEQKYINKLGNFKKNLICKIFLKNFN